MDPHYIRGHTDIQTGIGAWRICMVDTMASFVCHLLVSQDFRCAHPPSKMAVRESPFVERVKIGKGVVCREGV